MIVWHCLNTEDLQSCVDTGRTNAAALLTNQHVNTPNSSNVTASVSGLNSNLDAATYPWSIQVDIKLTEKLQEC